MVKLETSVRAVGDQDFQRLQEITRMHFNSFNDNTELLDEFRQLLRNVPTYVPNWTSPEISPDTYRLYGRKTPANEATRNLVETIRSSIPHDHLRESSAIDKERKDYHTMNGQLHLKIPQRNWINKLKSHQQYYSLKAQSMNLLRIKMVYTVKDKWFYYMIYLTKI